MRRPPPALLPFLLAGPLLAVSASLSSLNSAAGNGVRLAVLLTLFAVFYAAAVFVARRRPFPAAAVLLLGLVLRIPLILAPPVLSDDAYRYVWDGRVALSGENPFRYAPEDTALAPLRDANWSAINHPELVTIYPPAAQGLFLLAARILPGVTGLKVLLVILDLLIALLVLRRCARGPGESWRLVLYWWHPLPILEFAWSGHVDALGIAALAAAAWLAGGERTRGLARFAGAVLLLATSVLVKFLGVLAAPILFTRRRVAAALLFAAAAAAAYAPFLGSGVRPFGSLPVYTAKWRANDVLFGLLQRAGTAADQDMRLTEAKLYAAAIVLAILVLALLFRASRSGAIMTVIGAAVLVSPTVHPWYLAWILPFLADRFSPAWFVMSLTILTAYHPLPAWAAGGGWHESAPLKAAAIAPFLALGGWEAIRWLSGIRIGTRPGEDRPRPEAAPGSARAGET